MSKKIDKNNYNCEDCYNCIGCYSCKNINNGRYLHGFKFELLTDCKGLTQGQVRWKVFCAWIEHRFIYYCLKFLFVSMCLVLIISGLLWFLSTNYDDTNFWKTVFGIDGLALLPLSFMFAEVAEGKKNDTFYKFQLEKNQNN